MGCMWIYACSMFCTGPEQKVLNANAWPFFYTFLVELAAGLAASSAWLRPCLAAPGQCSGIRSHFASVIQEMAVLFTRVWSSSHLGLRLEVLGRVHDSIHDQRLMDSVLERVSMRVSP